MISFLAKIFIKNRDHTEDPAVRRSYGILSGIVGIMLNIFLFGIKYFAGAVSGSISVVADAFNNLSDAGSSLITLLGFKFAGAEPDNDHPFGHGRIEYISGFIVAMVIILMGFELGKSSIEKIITPTPVDTSAVTIVILILAICVKLYMFLYNRRIGAKIQSSSMKATATDSLSDAIATSVVLLSTVVMHFLHMNIDGWCGILVALFILYAGYGAAKDTISPLLGQKPSAEFVKEIERTVLAHKEIIGIHDLVVHDYGPSRRMISLHGEVSGNEDIFELHDVIDRIEGELNKKFGCEAVIHMDPIAVDDEKVKEMHKEIADLVHSIDEKLSIHDFRMVYGPTHTNLIFDVVVPPQYPKSANEIKETIQELVQNKWENYFCVIKVDTSYV